uniref:DMT family transporter n=1 Tax=Streptomyces sp. YIM 98790 TaxID=2689077 RepID=UPI001FB59798
PRPAPSAAPARPPAAGHALRLDLLLLTVAITGISLSGPLVTAIAAPALAVAFWRNAMAVAGLAPVVLSRPRLRRELRRMGRRELLLSLASGAVLAAHFACWIPSLRLTSVASSVALVTTTPIWVTLILRLRGHRPPARVWLGTAVAFGGMLLLTGVDFSLSARALAGDALALAGGLLAAVYVLIGAEARRTLSTTGYTFVCYSATGVLLLALCLATGSALGGYSGATWLKLLLLSVTAQLLGHSLLNRVVRGLGPSVTSTAILLETPGAALIAWAWLGQTPPAPAWPALAVIMLGLLLVIRGERAPEPAPPPVAGSA